MGRSFGSVRMGIKDLAERWELAARSMDPGDTPRTKDLVRMAKVHSSEAFYAFNDPLEAAFFSVAVSLSRNADMIAIQDYDSRKPVSSRGEHDVS